MKFKRNGKKTAEKSSKKTRISHEDTEFLLKASRIVYSQSSHIAMLSKIAGHTATRLGNSCIIEIFNTLDGFFPGAIIAAKADKKLKCELLPHNASHDFLAKSICNVGNLGKTKICPSVDSRKICNLAREKKLPILKCANIKSAVSIPLSFKKNILGTMTICRSSRKNKFSKKDMILAEEVSRRAAIIIENARLNYKVREGTRLHKEAKKKLEESNERMRNMLESTSDAFVSVDREWRYTYLNHNAEKYERRTKEQLIGKVMWEVFPEATKTLFYKKYHEAMRNGKPIDFEEFIDHKWFEIRVVPYPEGLSIYYRDITDKKLLDIRKDEFISMASHELKTPVTSIKIYTELLEKLNLGEKPKAYLGKMNSQITKLTKLIADLLDISKIQIGKLPSQKSFFNLEELLEDASSTFAKTDPAHKLVSKIRFGGKIWGDKDRIGQIITNLLANAAKYSPKDSKIILSTYESRLTKEIIISVQDFGIGIEKQYQDKIFGRFYRVATKEGKTYPGLGMGLYISHIIAEDHGGRMVVKSEPGKGSTFFVMLPSGKRHSVEGAVKAGKEVPSE